jgi:hypothetical protein
MTLENNTNYIPLQTTLRTSTKQDNNMGGGNVTNEIETPQLPSDSFGSFDLNEGVLVAKKTKEKPAGNTKKPDKKPGWQKEAEKVILREGGKVLDTASGAQKAFGGLTRNDFRALYLGPLIGDDAKKAKEITDHLNYLRMGNPSTVTLGTDRGLSGVRQDHAASLRERPTLPSNLYVITADKDGNLTVSKPTTGTVKNVVGVALKAKDGSIDLIRIDQDRNIGLTSGNTPIFSPITHLNTGFGLTKIK